MLQDVAAALAQLTVKAPVAFVTREPFALELARQHGFGVIEDHDEHGETPAIAMATRAARERGAEWTLVVPGDAPLLTAAEIEKVLALAPSRGAVLAPDWKWRGSNAIFRRPGNLFPLRFGDDSFLPHLGAAARTGAPAVVLELPGVAVDVDRGSDVEELLARPVASRAQQLLADFGVAARLAELHARAAGE
jgi:2-phospho-L-lactate guanylyltransferase